MIHHASVFIGVLGLGWALGLFYFGGLWITLRQLPRSRKPVVLFGWSYAIRLATILGIFHVILQRTPPEQLLALLLICFLGFLWSRTFLISRIHFRDHAV